MGTITSSVLCYLALVLFLFNMSVFKTLAELNMTENHINQNCAKGSRKLNHSTSEKNVSELAVTHSPGERNSMDDGNDTNVNILVNGDDKEISDILRLFINTNAYTKFDSVNERYYCHDITITTDLLPRLLKPNRQSNFIKMSNLVAKPPTRYRYPIEYKIQDFILTSLTFSNDVTENFIFGLAIFSEGFDTVINQDALSKYERRNDALDFASYCNTYGICSSNHLNATPITVTCYCDNLCHVYNDCCLNAQTNFEFTKEVNQHISKKMFMSCFENQYTSPDNISGYWIVSICPNYYGQNVSGLEEDQDKYIKARCETALDDAYFIPVISTKTGINYRNAYCALCHNEETYLYWSQEMLLQSKIFKKRISIAHTMSVHPPPGYIGRVCYNFTYYQCPSTVEHFQYGKYMSKLCRSHQNPAVTSLPLEQRNFPNIRTSLSVHRNMYCFICSTRYFELGRRNCVLNFISKFYRPTAVSWIFRLDAQLKIKNRSINKRECHAGEIWQSFLNKCVKMSCPMYKVPYNSACVDLTPSKSDGRIQITYYIKGKITEKIHNIFMQRLSKKLIEKIHGVKYLETIYLFVSKYHTRQSLIIMFWSNFQPISNIPVFKRWTFEQTTGARVQLVFIPALTEYMQIRKLSSKFQHWNIEKRLNNNDNNESIVCYTDHFSTNSGNGQFETCAYLSIYNSVNVEPQTLFLNAPLEEIVLTYLCMGMSGFALSIRLYHGLKEYRQHSSIKRILLHCMFVKLLSQVAFLVGCGANDIELMCYIIGVVLHYLWLSSFLWSSICAYFFYYVFVLAIRSMKNVIMSRSSSILSFTLLGYLLPLLVIALSVTVDLIKTDNLEMSYGKQICFITGKEVLLFGFGFPSIFMILFNFICFVTTAIHMMLDTAFISSWKGKFNRYFPVCFKMSILLSFTWCLAFIASWLDSHEVWMTFIVMDGIQGLLLSISSLPLASLLRILRIKR